MNVKKFKFSVKPEIDLRAELENAWWCIKQ